MTCPACQRKATHFPPGRHGGKCRDCVNEYHRQWREKNRDAHRASVERYRTSEKGVQKRRERDRLTKYGLTPEAFDALLRKQHGLCGVCMEPMGEDVAVDHCHTTGKVRGLLHRNCNAAIGQLGDDLTKVTRAATYLFRHAQDSRIHPFAVIGDPPEHRDFRDTPGLMPDIDPTARLEAFVTVDAGIEQPTKIGARAWLLKHVHVGHDAQIGADCELAPGTVIGGHAILEQGVRCGVNVSVRPFVRVGKYARLGAGAVVVKDVPAGEVWVGNPARNIEDRDDMRVWNEWYEASRA